MLRNLSLFSPLLSQAAGQRGPVPVPACDKDVTAPPLAIWGTACEWGCQQGLCLITGSVCSLGCSGGSTGLQGMFYRTQQSLWDFLNFTQTLFSLPPASLLLNKIASWSHQKQPVLLKPNFSAALKQTRGNCCSHESVSAAV